MVAVSKYEDLRKINSIFSKEHNRIINKYKIDFISLKGVNFPLICLYQIVDVLLKNNSKNLKVSDIVLLTLTSIGRLSKENTEQLTSLIEALKEKQLTGYFELINNTIKSLKNLLNIIFKKEGAVIQNIEQGLKYKYSNDALNLILRYIKKENIKIKDFSYWYIVDNRKQESSDLIDYINIMYYI
jgi:hypothetical protein